MGPVGKLKGIYLFKKKNSTLFGITHPFHEESKEIIWYENQIARQLIKRINIYDPLYNLQWHLHSNDNVNINVEKVWSKNITGEGIVIAIVDDGLEYTHPDLHDNYISSASYDFNYNDNDPFPDGPYDDHGTPAAGVAAARDNSACGVGSAYRAGLGGIRLLSQATTDAQEASALNYNYHINHIYSNSWGPIDDAKRKEGPGRLASLALENGVKNGREGRGSIFVWAAGNGAKNGDNCNYDGWANSRYTIAIAAVDNKGNQAWYSEPCSMLVVSAPSSGYQLAITTTDLRGTRGFIKLIFNKK